MGQKAANSFQSPPKGNRLMCCNGSKLLWSELGSWRSIINAYTKGPPVKVATLPWGFGLGDQANPFQACPLDWAWCPVRDHRTHPCAVRGTRSPVEVAKKRGRLSQGGCRSSRDSQALVLHPQDHPHPPGVRSEEQHLVCTLLGPRGHRPPLCSVALASGRAAPRSVPAPHALVAEPQAEAPAPLPSAAG